MPESDARRERATSHQNSTVPHQARSVPHQVNAVLRRASTVPYQASVTSHSKSVLSHIKPVLSNIKFGLVKLVQFRVVSEEVLARTETPGGGVRGRLYLTLHCHHQNDSCIKMGSDKSRFNV